MEKHIWKLIEAITDSYGNIQCIYQNELGEEYTYVTEDSLNTDSSYGDLRTCCWQGCSGDWPGCKTDCALFGNIANSRLEGRKAYEEFGSDAFYHMMSGLTGNQENKL